MSDDMREAQPSPIVEGKWPEGGPQSSTVIYLDAPPINVVVGMLCVLCEHARPGSLDTVPGLMAMVRETAQKLAAQPSAQGEPQCDRSRQINMDRDRLWEENGIPAAQPEPSAQGEAVECPCPPGVCRGGYPESCRTTLARFERESAPAAPAQAVPLNFDQLQRVMSQHFGGRELTDDEADSAEDFARAIERAHGIKEKKA